MIGYHYTTWEAYQRIQETGLQLSPLEERHKDQCWAVVEFVEDGCIWVYPEFMQGRELIGMVFYVAFRHDSHHSVCLAVDYAEWESARRLATKKRNDEVDDVRLTHDLDAGPFGHFRKPFDLVAEPIPSERIHLIGEWNLLDMIQQGEKRSRTVT